jgi:hypothetical protein
MPSGQNQANPEEYRLAARLTPRALLPSEVSMSRPKVPPKKNSHGGQPIPKTPCPPFETSPSPFLQTGSVNLSHKSTADPNGAKIRRI